MLISSVNSSQESPPPIHLLLSPVLGESAYRHVSLCSLLKDLRILSPEVPGAHSNHVLLFSPPLLLQLHLMIFYRYYRACTPLKSPTTCPCLSSFRQMTNPQFFIHQVLKSDLQPFPSLGQPLSTSQPSPCAILVGSLSHYASLLSPPSPPSDPPGKASMVFSPSLPMCQPSKWMLPGK